MAEFRTIEIDFDIHKLIEAERRSFTETPNEVLRRLLNMSTPEPSTQAARKPDAGRSWSGEGVTLPHRTALRMRYNGRQHEGQVVDGKWIVDGKTFDSPSGAASGVAITKSGKRTRLDGWIYWEVRVPGDESWMPISGLRRKTNGSGAITLDDLNLDL
jgi:hypothetical protein